MEFLVAICCGVDSIPELPIMLISGARILWAESFMITSWKFIQNIKIVTLKVRTEDARILSFLLLLFCSSWVEISTQSIFFITFYLSFFLRFFGGKIETRFSNLESRNFCGFFFHPLVYLWFQIVTDFWGMWGLMETPGTWKICFVGFSLASSDFPRSS